MCQVTQVPVAHCPDDSPNRRRRIPTTGRELVTRAAELRLVLRYPTDEPDIIFADLLAEVSRRGAINNL